MSEHSDRHAEFLHERGYARSIEHANELLQEAVNDELPLVETVSFQILAERLLARIHDTSWLSPESEDDPACDLLNSGATPDQIARFARYVQRSYLSDLCIFLDGSTDANHLGLPFDSFRVVCIDDDGNPSAMLEDFHGPLSFSDWNHEMQLSRQSDENKDSG